MSPVESPITQVPETSASHPANAAIYQQQPSEQNNNAASDAPDDESQGLPAVLNLELRGEQITVSRDTLVAFPESLLIAMFPNGLVLDGHEDQAYVQVDFDPACVRIMLDFFAQARADHSDHFSEDTYLTTVPSHYPLLTSKPVIIVLREELDYYVLPASSPPSNSGSKAPINAATMTTLKAAGGHHLLGQNQVFEALLRNISKENNMAEQHLVDMLCDAGFSRDDDWRYRALEPKRTSISSLSLVHLNTRPEGRLATAQKLMLFYGKPARKCWWDHACVELVGMQVRLWARRTWTLELALV